MHQNKESKDKYIIYRVNQIENKKKKNAIKKYIGEKENVKEK